MYTLDGSVVRLVGELSCIAAYWILYNEFGRVSCIDLFFDVSDGQFRCKINRTSSFKVNTVERSEDLSNNSNNYILTHSITKTCPYNVYPVEPQFYIAILGYVGVYLCFLFLLQNVDCGN